MYHSRCGNDAGDDCEDPADWDAPIFISATGHVADGAQIVVRASKVVAFYDDDPDDTGPSPRQVWVSYSSNGGVGWCKQAVDGSQGKREEIGLGPYGALPAVLLHDDAVTAGEYDVDVAYLQDDANFGGANSTTHVVYSSADLDDFVCAPTCDGATVACSDNEDCDRLGCCDRDGCGTCSNGYCTAPP